MSCDITGFSILKDQRIGFPEELFHGAVGGAVSGCEAADAEALEGLLSLFVLVEVEEQGGDGIDDVFAHLFSEEYGGAGQGGRCPFWFEAGGEVGSFVLEDIPGGGPDSAESGFSEANIEEDGFVGGGVYLFEMVVDVDALTAEVHQGHEGAGEDAVTGEGDGLVAAIGDGMDR
jgi:hypothetical protein